MAIAVWATFFHVAGLQLPPFQCCRQLAGWLSHAVTARLAVTGCCRFNKLAANKANKVASNVAVWLPLLRQAGWLPRC